MHGEKRECDQKTKERSNSAQWSSPLDLRVVLFHRFSSGFLLITIREEAEKFSTDEIFVVEEATTQRWNATEKENCEKG
jgi:hypothetical protein